MRKLLILRGLPGCGKSTWIKNHNLETYTISTDKLRLMFSSPILNIDDEDNSILQINQSINSKIWKLAFEILESRMKLGAFTVIDATNLKASTLSKYKKIAKQYRYRMGIIDFTNNDILPIDIIKFQNNKRKFENDGINYVDELEIDIMSNNIEEIPSGFTVINYNDEEKIRDFIYTIPLDMSNKYKKMFFIGDIHGCFSALNGFLIKNNNISENDGNFYIFLGDYFDRGFENVEVYNFLKRVKNYKNVLLLEGNHEKHLIDYANDKQLRNDIDFYKKTLPEFKKSGIDKKDIKDLTYKFAQMAYIQCNNKFFFSCHAGISGIHDMSKLVFINTKEFTQGTGEYNKVQNMADAWNNINKNKNLYQIFGHRNYFNNSNFKLNDTNYCLENHVEKILDKTGTLRVLEYDISKDAFYEHAFTNPKWNFGYEDTPNPHVKFLVDEMRKSHDLISEHVLHDGISSFNFTKTAFFNSKWTNLSTKARGLFIDTKNNEIVARSYDKFFNLNEMKQTSIEALKNNLSFPVVAYQKENGFLGILSVNSGKLFFCSKSIDSNSDNSSFAKMFELIFRNKILKNDKIKELKLINYLSYNDVSMVFECIDPENDPHIIQYSTPNVVLLDVIKNDIDFNIFIDKYEDLKELGKVYDMDVKNRINKFDDWESLHSFLVKERNQSLMIHSNNLNNIFEGYVFRDNKNFMFKFKSNYYLFWKMIRSQLEYAVISSGYLSSKPKKFTADFAVLENNKKIYLEMITIYSDFNNFMKSCIATGSNKKITNYDIKNKSIIYLRNLFYKNK